MAGKHESSTKQAGATTSGSGWGLRYPGLVMSTGGKNEVKEFTGMWPLKPNFNLQEITDTLAPGGLLVPPGASFAAMTTKLGLIRTARWFVGTSREFGPTFYFISQFDGSLDKYFDDFGTYLAALITYYGFVSLFPVLLLLTTGLGVVLAGRPDLQAQVLQSTLSQFPVIGSQLHQPEGLSGGTVAVVVGIVGALYGGLGVGQAVQNAMDSVWAVPRNNRPDPIRSRLRSLLLLLVLGSAAVARAAGELRLRFHDGELPAEVSAEEAA